MKIGILGGSFDPIHNGHLYMARKALTEYMLDEVWLMPAGHSPNKVEANMTSAFHRRNMCELACVGESCINTCSLETDSSEKSYTYRTMQKLTAAYPQHQFSFIMGADSLSYFAKWVHPEIICSLADILVVNRGEYSISELDRMTQSLKQQFPADIRFVHCEKYVISSQTIREKIKAHMDVSAFLPENVRNYIMENRLYQEE
jgi:nicotinate-nucleotide adenylyltransferase